MAPIANKKPNKRNRIEESLSDIQKSISALKKEKLYKYNLIFSTISFTWDNKSTKDDFIKFLGRKYKVTESSMNSCIICEFSSNHPVDFIKQLQIDLGDTSYMVANEEQITYNMLTDTVDIKFSRSYKKFHKLIDVKLSDL